MNTAITVPQFRSITCRDRRPEPASRVDDADHTGWPAPRWPASNVRAWRVAPPPGGPQALRSLVLDLSVRAEAARAVLSGASSKESAERVEWHDSVIKAIGARTVGKVVNDDRADWREA